MNSVNYEVFEPQTGENPTEAIVMGNILGGGLRNPNGSICDHAQRAQGVADQLGVFVVAYERPRPGRHIFDSKASRQAQPNSYIRTAARTGTTLSNVVDGLGIDRTTILGASAAGLDGIALSLTETIEPDSVVVYDPVGTRTTSWRTGFMEWLNHQKAEGARPDYARNHHPLAAPEKKLTALDNTLAGILRIPPDMARNGNFWRTNLAYAGLASLAMDKNFGAITLYAVFPGITFTDTLKRIEQKASALQWAADTSDRPTPALFSVKPNLYHSWTDDYAHLSALVRAARLINLFAD